jgi:hypothetical protein
VQPFDPKSYLGQVLAPYMDSAELPGLFERYLLEVDDADEAAIEARLDEVRGYWDKKTEHPRYGATIRLLKEKHREATFTLADPKARAKLADELRTRQLEQAEESARASKEWDELLEQLVRSGHGLEPAQRKRLEKMAASSGISAEQARAKLDAAPVAPEPELLDPGQRQVISRALTTLARDSGEPRMGLSLFHAFGLEIADELEAVQARHREQVEANQVRPHGNSKANWESVLSLAKIHLFENDPRAYVRGLLSDVREALEIKALKATADDGEIDEVEAEQLLREALALGLTTDLAQQVVADLAREYGAGLRTGAAVDFVACPVCNNPHPREAGDERCRRCGTALFIECPSGCGQKNDATAARCANCEADLHRYTAALRAVNRLDGLIADGRPAQARDDLAEAARVLGRSNPDVERSSRRVMAAAEAAKRTWAEVEAARADRRQYAARGLLVELEKTAKDFPGPAGELPGRALDAVRERLGEAEAMLQGALALDGDPRERALVNVLRIAVDCAEAERELDKLPPEPPGKVTAAASGTVMAIAWSPSASKAVDYLVTRIAAGGAKAAVGETDGLRIEDARAPAGTLARYTVEAVRGRARSTATISADVTVAYEVGDFLASGADGEVRLSWKSRGDAGRVLVSRREEESGSEVAIIPDAAGVVDRAVVNGRRYTYLVQVDYPGPAGGLIRTPGRTAFAQPVERPKPLEDLAVSSGPAGVTLDFEAPAAGTVSILRCAEDPELELGAALDPGRLAELGHALSPGGSSALDPDPPSGRCFYQAVTVAAGVAIAGAVVAHVALPEISNVRAVANGREAKVTWTWPDGITLARVVWRHDSQPDGPEDAAAEAIDYRLGEYRDSGGCSIGLGEQRALFVAVYPAIRADGEIACGSGGGKGSRAALRTKSKTELRYAVRRSGRLQKRLEVEVCEPAAGTLPELLLVAREGELLPRTASDGTVLARLGGDGPRASTVELRGLSRPLAVKLFLGSAGAASSFVLFDPMADDLLIG